MITFFKTMKLNQFAKVHLIPIFIHRTVFIYLANTIADIKIIFSFMGDKNYMIIKIICSQ